MELHAKNSTSIEYVRAMLTVDAEEPLHFRRTARLKSGETYPTELEYEKLLKVCFGCKRLTHDQTKCPLQHIEAAPDSRVEHKKSSEGNLRKKLQEKELKAKESLRRPVEKGVVINSKQASAPIRQSRDKTQVHSREEKKKGKMIASTPQVIWTPKSIKGGTEKTRSTEKSIAYQRSSEETGGTKSVSFGPSVTHDSVFQRLRGLEED